MDRIHFLNTTIANIRKKLKPILMKEASKRTREEKEELEEGYLSIEDLIQEREDFIKSKKENQNETR